VPSFQEVAVDYDPGQSQDIQLFDGSSLRLRKLREDYDPTDRANAVRMLMESRDKQEVLTGSSTSAQRSRALSIS